MDKDPGTTVHSPGRLKLYTTTEKGLIGVAHERGWEIQKVEFIRLANVEGSSKVWMYPTDATDPDRLVVKRYKSRLDVNASDTLAAWDMALPKNQWRRFDILTDKLKESPVGPAL